MAKQHQIRILPDDVAVAADEGALLYDVLSACGRMPAACCGGNGTCGKCGVDVTVAGVTTRLFACRTRVTNDMTVMLPTQGQTEVLTGGVAHIASVTPREGYSVAFDIGTTTIVCYLLDGPTGRELAVRGMLNPQASFGADVISRANYTLSHGTEALTRAVTGAMNELIAACCAEVNVSESSVRHVAVVGNTVMQHLLLGISPEPLVLAPYLPRSCAAVQTTAQAIGLAIPAEATVHILPLIAGFVGADTVGCLLATDFPTLSGNTLLMDIGTNGELVLGNSARRIACSTAAGPAFEGAKILFGMRGATGAIDHASLVNGKLGYTVIGGGKPIGICGSGLVDIVACLLRVGTISASGRIETDEAFAERITTLSDGTRAFIVAGAEESGCGEAIVLTQRDVRELQYAKGALAAGILLMAKALGIQICDIDRVLVAGAFGNYLNSDNACAIGLIPAALMGRIENIGNAAGEGAKLAAMSDEMDRYADTLAQETEYLELAKLSDFQDTFVSELTFPVEEEEEG